MDNTNISDFLESGQTVSSFKVSGFDLVVVNQDGQQVTIDNGVSDILVNNMTLPETSGAGINFERVIQAIPDSGAGFDTVYLEDMFLNNNSEIEVSDELRVELESRYEQLLKLFTQLKSDFEEQQRLLEESSLIEDDLKALQQQIEEREQQLQENESLLEQQAQIIEEQSQQIEDATAAQAPQETTTAAEELRNEQLEPQLEPAPPAPPTPPTPPTTSTTSTPPTPPAESSTSSSDSSAPAPVITPSPELAPVLEGTLFVTGGLDEESDSGKVGDNVTNNDTPTFSGTTLSNQSVSLTVEGNTYSISADAEGNWRFTLPAALANGDYQYEISADNGIETVSDSGTVTIDTVIPELTEVMWRNPNSDTADLVNQTTPILSGQSSANATIVLEIGGNTYKTLANEVGEWSIAVINTLPEGASSYTLTASTVAGNTDTLLGSVTVDTSVSASSISLDDMSDSGAKQDFITNQNQPSFTGRTEANATIELTLNGETYTIAADPSGVWAFTAPELVDGTYEIALTITDEAGNHIEQLSSITIDTVIPTTNVILTRDDNSVVTNGHVNSQTPTLTGTTEPESTVTVNVGGTDYQVISDAEGHWAITFDDGLAESTHNYSVVVVDIAGNTSNPQIGSFVVDVTQPADPTVVIAEASNSADITDTLTNVTNPILQGTAEANTAVTITFDNGFTYQVIANTDGEWSQEIGPFSKDGSYNYTISAADAAGNQSNDVTGNITIDTVMPALTGGLDADSDVSTPGVVGSSVDNRSSDETPTFSGTATPGETVVLLFNEKEYSYTIPSNSPTGEWAITIPVVDMLTIEEVYEYTLSVTTAAGNSMELNGQYIFDRSVDGTDPSPEVKITRDDGTEVTNGFVNTQTPTLSGLTEPYSSITVNINGIDHNATANALGNWFITFNPVLTEGNYNYSAVTVDPDGNISAPQTGSFVIDVTIPTDPTVDFAEGSNSGDPSDTITNIRTPILEGTAEPDSTVIITFDSGEEYRVTVDSDGAWRQEIGPFNDGSYDYTIVAEDAAMNQSRDVRGNVTVDTVIPVLTGGLDSDSDSGSANIVGSFEDNRSNDDTPTFSGTATPGEVVILEINGKSYSQAVPTTSTTGAWTITIPVSEALSIEDEYDYKISVTTVAGNKSEIEGTYTFDSTVETTSDLIISRDDGTTVTNGFVNTQTPTLSGTTEPDSYVAVSINGTNYNVLSNAQGEWRITFDPALTENTYNYSLTVIDPAGNVTNPKTGSFTVDITKPADPTVGLAQGSNSGDINDTLTNVVRPSLEGTAEPNTTVFITFDNGLEYRVVADANGDWNQEIGPFTADGSYNYTIKVEDAAGNQSGDVTGNITLDTVLPQLTGGLDSDSDTGSVNITGSTSDNRSSDAMPTFSGTAAPGQTVILEFNGKSYSATVPSSSTTGEWTITVPPADMLTVEDFYSYRISATTPAGNSSEINGAYIFDTGINVSTPLPDLVISRDDGSMVTNGFVNTQTPTLSGVTEPQAYVTVAINGTNYNTVADAQGVWSITFSPPLTENTYNYSLTIADIAGNISSPETGSFVVDVTPPAVPTVDFAAGSNSGITSDTITNVKAPTLEGQAEANTTVLLTFANGLSYQIAVDANGNWQQEVGPFNTDGSYNYTIKVEDAAGNQSLDVNGNITVDTVVPTLTGGLDADSDSGSANIAGSTEDNRSNDDTPKFSGTADPGQTVVIEINGKTYSQTVPSSSTTGDWSIEIPVSDRFTVNDSYDYTISVTTAAGNKSEIKETYVFDNTIEATSDITISRDDGSSVTNGYVNTQTPTLSGTTEPDSYVTVAINGTNHSVLANAQGEWSISFDPALTESTYNYSLTVVDPAGNVSLPKTGSFIVDVTDPVDPTVTLAQASNSGDTTDSLTNVTYPVLTGTAEANTTVLLTFTSGLSYRVVADTDGTWSQQVGPFTSDGNYSYTVKVEDAAGNQSNDVSGNIIIDTVLPPLTGGLDPDSDTGSANIAGSLTDNRSSDETPTFSGTAAPGQRVELEFNGKTYTHTVPASSTTGEWAITIPTADMLTVDSTYAYKISAITAAGNKSEINGTYVFDANINVIAPTSSMTISRDDGTEVTNGFVNTQTPTLSGITEPEAHITVNINGINHNAVADAQGVWTIEFSPPLAENTYNYSLAIVDTAGNTYPPQTGAFTVDVTAPSDPTVDFALGSNSGNLNDTVTNITSPVLEGKAEPNAKVILTFDNGMVFEAIADTNGDWRQRVGPFTADAQYNYTVKVEDAAGNQSSDVTGNIIIDTSTISAPSPEITITRDDGSVVTNGFVNTQTPTLSGTADPNVNITVNINGVDHHAVANTTGNWFITFDPALTEDTYNYTAVTIDAQGNTSAPQIGTFVIDVTMPPVPTVDFAEGSNSGDLSDTITNVKNPILEGTSEPNSTVIILFDNSLSYRVEVDSDGNWSQEVGPFNTDGSYNYVLLAEDAALNQSTTLNGSITIDTVIPTLTGGLDADSDSGSANIAGSMEDNRSNDDTPKFSGTADPGQTVVVEINGKTYSQTVPSSSTTGDWSIEIPVSDRLTVNDSYDYTISVTTVAGNKSEIKETYVFDNTVEATSDITISRDDGSSVTNGYVNTQTPTLSGTTEPGSYVTVTLNGTNHNALANAQGEWSISFDPALTESTYNYSLTVVDPAGNASAPKTGTFIVDVTAPVDPTVALAQASNSGDTTDSLTNVTYPVLTGTAEANTTVLLTFASGSSYRVVADTDGTWSQQVGPFTSDGNYSYTVKVEDAAGNQSNDVNGNIIIDTVLPPLTGGLDSGSDTGSASIAGSLTDNRSSDETPTFSGTAAAGQRVDLEFNGKTYSYTVPANSTTGAWSITIPAADMLTVDNTYAYKISAVTPAGNQSEINGNYFFDANINIATTTSDITISRDDGSAVTNGFVNTQTPTLSGVTEPQAYVTLAINGTNYNTVADAQGVWSITFSPPLTENTYNYSLTIADIAGNVSSPETGSFVVDVTPPAVPTVDFAAGSNSGITSDTITNVKAPTLEGQAEANTTVLLTFANGLSYQIAVDANGNWQQEVGPFNTDGSYNYTIKVEDAAGNQSLDVNGNITVDTVLPILTGGLDADSDSGNVNITGSTSDKRSNEDAPTFSGTATAGETVILEFNGKTYNYTVPAGTPVGNWTITIPPADALNVDDNYAYRISVTTAAGNVSEINDVYVFDTTIDTNSDVIVSRDDGTSVTNGFVNTQTPTLSGVTEPNSYITVSVNGTDHNTLSNNQGEWSITFNPPLAENTYNYSLLVIDPAGNVSVPKPGTFVVDVTIPAAPTVDFAAGSNSGDITDTVTNVTLPTLEGTAEPNATVVITFANGQSYRALVDTNGDWRQAVGPFTADGSYNYTIKTEDAAGNQSTDVNGNITIDTVVPSLTGGLDSSSDTGNSALAGSTSDNRSSDDSPTFSGTATPGQTVILEINGKSYSYPVPPTSITGAWSITIPPADVLTIEDDYPFKISVTTPAGNSEEITGIYTFDSTVITDAGITSATDSGASDTDSITSHKRPDFSGQTEPGSTVVLTYNGNNYNVTVNADGSWVLPYPESTDLTDDTYSYTLDITDPAGNKVENVEYKFTVDTVAQTSFGLAASSIGGDGSDTALTNLARPTLIGTAEPGATVTFVWNGNRFPLAVDDDGNWRFTPPTSASVGSNSYTIEMTDLAGNSDTFNGAFTFVIDGTIAPEGKLALHADDDSNIKGDLVTNNNNPRFIGSVEPTNATGQIEINGTSYNLVIDSRGEYTFQLPTGVTLREGSNVIKAVFTHPDNGITHTVSERITVDSIAEAIDADITRDTGVDGDWHTQTRVNTFSGTGDAGSTVILTIQGTATPFTITVPDSGNWSIPTTRSLADGTYRVNITQTDLAGNISTLTKNLIVDNSSVISPTFGPGHFTVGRSNLFTEDPSFIIDANFIRNNPQGALRVEYGSIQATFRVSQLGPDRKLTLPPGLLENESYTGRLTIIATDNAGNVASYPYTLNVYKFNPTITGGLASQSDSDTKGDKITTDVRPDFEGITNAKYVSYGQYSGTIKIAGETYPITISNQGGFVAWSFTYPDSAPDLGASVYTYQININAVGNQKSETFEDVVTISPVVTSLDPTTNSGDLDDWMTNNDSPIVIGTTDVGGAIRVQVNGVYYNVTVQSDGKWSFPLPGAPLVDGRYDISIQEIVNGTTVTLDTAIIIDSVPPSGSTIELSSNSLPGTIPMTSGDATPTFEGTTKPNSTVLITINGKNYSGTSDQNGVWSVNVSDALPHGNNDYVMTVTDKAGNSEVKKGTLFSDIDHGASLNYKLDGVPAVESGDYRTSDMVFVGNGKPGMLVTLTHGSRTVSTTVDNDGNWSLDASRYFSSSGDNARWSGRTIEFSDPATGAYKIVTINVVQDLSVSTAGWSALAEDSQTAGVADPSLTYHTQPTLRGRTEAYDKVQVVIGSNTYETQSDASGYWTLKVPNDLANGTYPYTVNITDRNLRPFSIQGSFRVDADDPNFTVNHTSPDPSDGNFDSGAQGDGITKETNHLFSGKIDPTHSIVFNINGRAVNVNVDSLGNWSVAQNNLTDDTYNYEVVVTTAAGKQDSITGSFVVDTVVAASTGLGLDASTDSGIVGDNLTNDNKPRLSGVAEPGSKVTLEINGKTYTGITDSRGGWGIDVTDALPDNTHTYTVTLEDVAGNVSAPTTGTVTVASVATGVGTINVSLTNDPGNDGIINDIRPTVGGNATPNALIQVTILTETYNTVAQSDGSWSLLIADPLEDGVHSLVANVLDNAGNVLASDSLNFTINTTTQVTLDGVTDADNVVREGFTNNATPTFKGSAEAGSTVEIVIDGQRKSTVANADGTWEITLDSPLRDNTYGYDISVVDTLGNRGTLDGLVTVDAQAPTTITGGLAADSQANGDINTTTSNMPNFAGTTEPGAEVTLTVAGKNFTVTADAQGAWLIDYATLKPEDSGLPTGNHPYSISVTDKSGNTTLTPFTGSFTVADGKPPTTNNLLASDDSGVQGDSVTNNTQPTIVGTTSVGSSITVTIDSVPYVVRVDSSGTWSFEMPNVLTEGLHKYSVTATDIFGNSDTQEYEVTVDLTPAASPSNIQFDGSVGSDNSIASNLPIMSGKAEADSTVNITIGGRLYTTTADASGDWKYEFQPHEALAAGVHSYSVTVVDIAGNMSSSAVSGAFTIRELTASLSNTQDGDTAPSANSTSDTTPTLSGKGLPSADITVTINSNNYTTTVDSNGDWSVNISTALAVNVTPYNYTVQESLNGVVTNTTQGQVTVTPAAPSNVQIIGAVGSDNFIGSGTPTIKGEAESNSTIRIQIGSNVFITTADAMGDWNYVLKSNEALTTNTYQYRISVVDAGGNNLSSVTTGSFTVTEFTAQLSATQDSDPSPTVNATHDKTPSFSGTGIPGATIMLTIDGNNYTATVDSSGSWSLDVGSALSSSVAAYSYTVQESFNSVSTGTTQGQVTITSVAPSNIQIVGAMGSDNFVGNDTPTIRGEAESNSTVRIQMGSSVFTTTADVNGNWSYELQPSEALTTGGHQYQVSTVDATGNNLSSVTTGTFTVTELTVSLSSTQDGDASPTASSTSDTTPTLNGTGMPGADIELTIDSNVYRAKVDNNGQWSIDVSGSLTAQALAYNYTVQESFNSVATGNTSGEVTITSPAISSMSAPVFGAMSAPVFSAMSAQVPDAKAEPQKEPQFVSFSGQASPLSYVALSVENRNYSGMADTLGNWKIDVPSSNISQDNISYEALVTDDDGNEILEKGTLNVANIENQVEDQSSSNTTTTAEETIHFEGNTLSFADVSLTFDNKVYHAMADKDGFWQIEASEPAVEDNYSYSVKSEVNGVHVSDYEGSVTIGSPSSVQGESAGTEDNENDDVIFEGKMVDKQSQVKFEFNNQDFAVKYSDDGENWSVQIPSQHVAKENTYKVEVTTGKGEKFITENNFEPHPESESAQAASSENTQHHVDVNTSFGTDDHNDEF